MSRSKKRGSKRMSASGAGKQRGLSDSLREEAERRWADADRATARRTKRRAARAKALKSTRKAAHAQRKKIGAPKTKLRRGEASRRKRAKGAIAGATAPSQ